MLFSYYSKYLLVVCIHIMYVKRLFRRYRSEIRIILLLVVLTLFIHIYHGIQNIFAPKVEGTTLSTSDVITPEYKPTNTPIPTLIVPTTVQINIYVSNTTPIYNQLYNSYLSPLPSSNPTLTVSDKATPFPTSIIQPTSVPTYTPTQTPTATPTLIPLLSSFTAKYFNNMYLTGEPTLIRTDSEVNFSWEYGSPDTKINNDSFSAIWTATINASEGNYLISLNHDDGMKVYIDNNLIHNHWVNKSPSDEFITLHLDAGTHSLRIEYYEYLNGATAIFNLQKL